MMNMDALKRYGGGLVMAAIGSGAGVGFYNVCHNFLGGNQAYTAQSADYLGLAGLVAGVGLGVATGIAHAVTYRSRAQQNQAHQQQAPQNPPQVQGGQGNQAQQIHIHFHNHP